MGLMNILMDYSLYINPKGLILDILSWKQLALYVDKINNCPRNSLGYRTPRKVFFEASFALQA